MGPGYNPYEIKNLSPKKSGGGKGGILLFILILLVLSLSVLIFLFARSCIREKRVEVKPVAAEEKKSVKKIPVQAPKALKPVTVIQGPLQKKILGLCETSRQKLKKENYRQARDYALQALKLCPDKDSALWKEAAELLSKANTAIFFTDYPFRERKTLYTVQRGDVLQNIASRYNSTVEAIQKGNNMSPLDFSIRDGQTLCIYKGDWSIKVDKARRRLYLYDGNGLFKLYNIGVGRQDRTPVGTFEIVSKIKEPDWFSPKGKIPFGSKENVLGTRWLKLKPTGNTNTQLRGYGIHGTWQPESIGKARSNGCIRMRNEEVEELFTIVPNGTPVTIVESENKE